MRYYCTRCGARDLRKKNKSNGCLISAIELVLLILAIPSFGLTLLGILICECCVKKTPVCRQCGAENTIVPMDSPRAKQALGETAS